ncbi:polysaccharide deacetylase family protein [Fictibacillus sp. FJAT-27399]|uniref:polysaccharide deacetylase family protein n=1 Tax=Fictibacillus sp. FJAT-27399 TaxID=1729689 RepID=UPI0009E83690|nr:polysaccharide deacetylase family protein [Fictibacillus sp. FJAT-27399]
MKKGIFFLGLFALLLASSFILPNQSVTASKSSEVYTSGPKTKKVAALTFDDGPDGKTTDQILYILKKYHVKATFFVVGKQVKAYPSVIKRIHKDGHYIGNHTYSHPSLTKSNRTKIRSELTKTNQLLHPLIGYQPAVMRPPYGSYNNLVISEAKRAHMKVVIWSVDTRDWSGVSTGTILNTVKKETRPGAIILQHTIPHKNMSNTTVALPKIIERLKKQGYTFVTVPEMLGMKK